MSMLDCITASPVYLAGLVGRVLGCRPSLSEFNSQWFHVNLFVLLIVDNLHLFFWGFFV